VGTVIFPTYASGGAALSALQTNQLAWGGNSLIGVHTVFASAPNHKTWFAPVQTNSLEPNLTKWPTNQLAVRQAISLAIDRTALSQQAEDGLEPVAQELSGITLPAFRDFVVPTAHVPAHSNIAAAREVLKKAGYVLKNGFFEKGGKTVAFNITNPSNFTDYAQGDEQIARSLQRAGMDVKFVGQATTAWSADIVSGNFSLTQHWSQTSVSPFQLYNDWLNSKLASTSGGNYERLNSSSVDAMLNKLGSDQSAAAQKRDLAPIERYVATDLPIIPTDYGVSWDEYNTSQFSGWPTPTNAYESGSPNAPTNEVVILHLRPKG
jgi:peptide/nickel transport system substrate-binding protein